MPDYDASDEHLVKLTIHGSVIDPAYSELLMQKGEIPFEDVLALDRVQKKLEISDEAIKRLRRAKLIEGRKPHFHVSANVASATASKADYMRTRSLDNQYYKKLITECLTQFGKASRKDIDDFLLSKLSDALNYDQKKTKIRNLLSDLSRAGVIQNNGSRKAPKWQLAK